MTASSLVRLSEETAQVARAFGFAHFYYRGRFPDLRTGDNEIFFDNCPSGWREHCLGIGEGKDPLLARALREVTPILWREALPAHRGLLHKAREFGLATGVILPVHGPAAQWSTLTLAKQRDGVDAERDILAKLAECQLLSAYVHEAAARVIRRRMEPGRIYGVRAEAQPVPVLTLSQREREFHALAATGKTAAETARMLAISERTVAFHLANARRKLGTSSSPHAAIKAYSLGLIAAG